MVDLFVNWENRQKINSKHTNNLIKSKIDKVKIDSDEKNLYANELSKRTEESELIFRGKIGESLAKVAKQLGFFYDIFLYKNFLRRLFCSLF